MDFKRAFVTGGAGFIGSHVVDELLRCGIDVVVYDNLCTGRAEYLNAERGMRSAEKGFPEGREERKEEGRKGKESLTGGNGGNGEDERGGESRPTVRLIQGDVLDLPRVKEAMKGCDFVFHFQANADVRGGKENARVDLEQNTIATWNVLDSMRVHGIKGIAFASSATIYGEPDVFPTPENYAPLQTSLYGASKFACEAMIQAYCEYYGMRSFVYRFVSWIGERYSHGVVFDFMKKLKTDPTRLLILGDGTQRKSYLYVKDGVAGIMLGIEKSEGSKNIYNLGHDDFMNVIDLAKIILDEMGLKNVKFEFTGGVRGWLGDSPFVHLDTSRIKKLGWKPQTSIEEGIRRTARYLKQHPEVLERA